MDPMISFKQFTFKYETQQKPTLIDINLDIYPGEKILILGPSGSGKSTLGNCINGLIPNHFEGTISGECIIDNQLVTEHSIFDISKSVGTILQDSDAQFVGLSVGEDIAFSLENQAVSQVEMAQKVYHAAKIVGVSDMLNQLPYALSGGQKQRVAMAGILHENIKILLLDEPLAALDPKMGEKMVELIDQLNQKKQLTTVVIEHRLEEVLHRSIDRIVLMDQGRIVTITTPNELLHSSLLKEYGIREPLYISALKNIFADVVLPKQIDSLDYIDLSNSRLIYSNEITTKNQLTNDTMPKLVEMDHVAFSYDKRPFISIDKLMISAGERIAILGENGSGKTTLARLLTGVCQPNAGQIKRMGNPTTLKEIAGLIGYVMQNPNHMLVEDIVYDEVKLALEKRNYSETEIDEIVRDVLEITGLYSRRNWPINALSYGQKKRVSVAVVLALRPKCIILDEPTAGQDYAHYREMMEFVQALNDDYQMTVIFITHDMHLALEYTDRAIVMEDGKIIADDATFSILNNDQLLERASLKKTSIFKLANKLNLDIESFIRTFIEMERAEYYEQ
ncbi:heme ABC transporter ATP-binding protein [Dolosigranulum pigrum]|uniref:Heme ABC transporter ATP-binding protein n=2 Tax=Dolosigranulum pigrum TaxID=29394 RepID=A0A328KVV0_9LACT|nr:heme ABC transporter ATP-binding protein [Dolosigranulum pigrum]